MFVDSSKASNGKDVVLDYEYNHFFNVIGVEWLYKGLEQYTYITVRSLVFKVIALFVTLCLVRKKAIT